MKLKECFNNKSDRWILFAGFTLLAGLLITISALCMVPPVSRDALVHHLAVPKIYIEHGNIVELPCMNYSYYPMNLDMLYMVALYAGSDIAAKFIHFLFGILTSGLIFHYLKNRMNINYALAGAVLFFTIPIVIKLSITVYVDLGLVFFTTASLIAILYWAENNFQSKYLILSALACGFALGTKYNGLVSFLLLTMLIPFIYSRNNGSRDYSCFVKSFGWALVFVGISLAVFSPWMIRNAIWTGNPVYPLYNQYFPSEKKPLCKIGSTEEESPSISPLQKRRFLYEETWPEIFLLPLRVFFQGKDDNPRFFDGKLTPILLFLPFFAFMNSRHSYQKYNEEKWILLSFAILFFCFVMFSRGLRIRYFAPSIPCLVILSIYGIHNLMQRAKSREIKPVKYLAIALLSLSAVHIFWSTGRYIVEQFNTVKPFAYLQGEMSRDEYISTYRKEYPVIQYANEHLSKEAEILFIYIGKRGYYCNVPYIPDQGHNLSRIFRLIENRKKPVEISNWLKSRGITHLLIHNGTVKKRVKKDLKPKEKLVFYKFINNQAKLVYHKNGFELYSLRNLTN